MNGGDRLRPEIWCNKGDEREDDCNQSSDMSPDRALDRISQGLDWRLVVQEGDVIEYDTVGI